MAFDSLILGVLVLADTDEPILKYFFNKYNNKTKYYSIRLLPANVSFNENFLELTQ